MVDRRPSRQTANGKGTVISITGKRAARHGRLWRGVGGGSKPVAGWSNRSGDVKSLALAPDPITSDNDSTIKSSSVHYQRLTQICMYFGRFLTPNRQRL